MSCFCSALALFFFSLSFSGCPTLDFGRDSPIFVSNITYNCFAGQKFDLQHRLSFSNEFFVVHLRWSRPFFSLSLIFLIYCNFLVYLCWRITSKPHSDQKKDDDDEEKKKEKYTHSIETKTVFQTSHTDIGLDIHRTTTYIHKPACPVIRWCVQKLHSRNQWNVETRRWRWEDKMKKKIKQTHRRETKIKNKEYKAWNDLYFCEEGMNHENLVSHGWRNDTFEDEIFHSIDCQVGIDFSFWDILSLSSSCSLCVEKWCGRG